MAKIVNTRLVGSLAASLGWDSLNTAEMEEWIAKSGIDPAGVVTFMRAVLANPDGVDDSTMTSVASAQLPYIESWFRDHGFIF